MIASTLLVFGALFSASPNSHALGSALAVWAPASRPAQEDDVPDKRADVKEWTSALKEHAKQGGDEDPQAVALIDTLIQQWESLGPKDRGLVVKTLDGVFKQKRRPRDDGTFPNQLFMASAVALGEMGGPDSAKVLARWVGHKNLKDDKELQRILILSLGRTKDPAALKTLLSLLKHPQHGMQAAGAEALGDFEGAELKERKKLFEAVLKQLVPLHNSVLSDSSGSNMEIRARLDAVSGPMIKTLRRLSGHEERDPNEFQRWWNKNKKADWDAA